MTARLVVLISGNGSNLQAILDACKAQILPAEVAAVFSNKAEAFGLERARQSGIPAVAMPTAKGQERSLYDAGLGEAVAQFQPDWVVLAGWMRLLSANFLERFPQRVINLHPALPGGFPGTHAIERAYAAYQRGEIDRTGVMVHLVPDEGVDNGPVLGQADVLFTPGEALDALETRLHEAEHILFVDTLKRVILDPDFVKRV
jgi:phosphoribosylglycinamide formyltransferase 1